MSTHSTLVDCAAIHSAFHAGVEVAESLDAQLDESLAALEAYQSHLDGWQQQLAQERDEFQQERDQFDRDRAAAEQELCRLTAATKELDSLREQNAALDASLIARGDELLAIKTQRAELAIELEHAKARETELNSELEAERHTLELERAEWAQVSQQLREDLELRLEAALAAAPGEACGSTPAFEKRATGATSRESSSSSAVLGSIVEQFGKLRQQRATDRQSSKKTR
jgi:chromosome segregation ATPase